MNDHLEEQLRRLPEPLPPSSLLSGVMARVVRISDNAPIPKTAKSRVRWHFVTDQGSALALFSGIAIVAFAWLHGGSQPLSLRDLAVALESGRGVSSGTFWLTAGAWLYVAGLIGPFGARYFFRARTA